MNEREQFEKWLVQEMADHVANNDRDMVKHLNANVVILEKAWQAARASQPAQDPVAWKTVPRFEDVDGYFDYTPSKETADELVKRGWQCIPLFTTPPSEAARIAELEAKLQKERDYIKRMDAVIDGTGLVQSCINPLEDLKIAVNYAVSKIAELEAKLAECEKDAERYRWLRVGDNDELVIQRGPVAPDYKWLPRLDRLDAMIDEHISRQALADKG